MPPSTAAYINRRALRAMLIGQLQTALSGSVSVYDGSEATQVPETGSWCQIVAVDTEADSRGWSVNPQSPDSAKVVVTISVGVAMATIRADMGALDTALSKVAKAVDQVALTDSATHRLELDRAGVVEDPAGIDDTFIRSGAVTVTGRAYRITGTV